jgi:DNA replication ATP-dependent helicase Dna2
MAAAMQRRELPPVLGPGECGPCSNCFVSSVCATAHCANEAGTAASFGDETAFLAGAAALLTDDRARREYLSKWEGLVMREEEFSRRGAAGEGDGDAEELVDARPYWMASSAEADAAGTCFGRMRYRSVRDSGAAAGRDRFTYRFVREPGGRSLEYGYAIGVGDEVQLSTENVFDVAAGHVVQILAQEVYVSSRHRIKPPGYAHMSHLALDSGEDAALRRIAWRIDRISEHYSQCKTARANLYRLFSNTPHDNMLVRRIVDKVKPTFGAPVVLLPKLIEPLNSKQRAALQHVLAAEDYSLVLGMPGTGKSMLITVLIEHCIAAKQSVLISSHTNSAVDNVLLRLKQKGIRFLRLGYPESVHVDVRPFTLDAQLPVASRTVGAVDELMRSVSVVGVTCISASTHKLLESMRKSFELCIVDEASQVQPSRPYAHSVQVQTAYTCAPNIGRGRSRARTHARAIAHRCWLVRCRSAAARRIPTGAAPDLPRADPLSAALCAGGRPVPVAAAGPLARRQGAPALPLQGVGRCAPARRGGAGHPVPDE